MNEEENLQLQIASEICFDLRAEYNPEENREEEAEYIREEK